MPNKEKGYTSSAQLIVGNISVRFDADEGEIFNKGFSKMKRAGIDLNSQKLHFRLYKKSVDARKKDDIRLVCSIIADVDDENFDQDKLKLADAKLVANEQFDLSCGSEQMQAPPLVVGMGPAGLFAALMLAENGYEPIIIDRGDSVRDRVIAVEKFYTLRTLDTESNIQFGAGGAGTFSDGKLVTRINDSFCSYVLEKFVQFGAPRDILTKAKPHIGTDILRTVVNNMLERIETLGGTVIYRCKLIGIEKRADSTLVAKTTKGDILCSAMVLALGHSARDTYSMLIERGFAMEAKPMSVGVRIEHLSEDIDSALYGKHAGHPALGRAEYALSDTKSDRGVYTFCMCPGGSVVAAASEDGGVVVNGMSNFARDGENSNSAVLVSVRPEDYEKKDGSILLGAIEYQRNIEHAAYLVGGSDYSAPIQTVGDFLSGKVGSAPSRVNPTYMDGAHVKLANLSTVFPAYVSEKLRYGLLSFDRKIKGFAAPDALLTAAETRTSAPLRILRGENFESLSMGNVYPCGEGAGYAGGISSASVDGLRVALAIIHRFSPKK